MRPASAHFATSRFVSTLGFLAVVFALAALALGQAAGTKRKLLQPASQNQSASQQASASSRLRAQPVSAVRLALRLSVDSLPRLARPSPF